MTQNTIQAIVAKIETEYAAAFCSRDARALAALFTEEATALTEWGDVMQGQTTFEKALARAFTRMPGELQAKITPTYAATITSSVIVVHGTVQKVVGGEEERLAYTRVLVRRDGKWRIAAVQVAPLSALPDPRR